MVPGAEILALREAERKLRALRKKAGDQLASLREDPTTILVGRGAIFWVSPAAKRFYDSPAYEDAKRLRAGAAKLNMVAVQGAE